MPENVPSEKPAAEAEQQSAQSESSASVQTGSPSAPQAQPFNIEDIKSKVPKAFHGYIEPIIQWAQSVEKRFSEIEKTLPEAIKTQFKAALTELQKESASASQGRSPSASGGAGAGSLQEFLPVIAKVLGEGGGQTENPFAKEAQTMALESMREDISFTKAMKQYFIQKVAQKTAGDLVEAAEK